MIKNKFFKRLNYLMITLMIISIPLMFTNIAMAKSNEFNSQEKVSLSGYVNKNCFKEYYDFANGSQICFECWASDHTWNWGQGEDVFSITYPLPMKII